MANTNSTSTTREKVSLNSVAEGMLSNGTGSARTAVLGFAIFLHLVGCGTSGPTTYKVQGKVTYDGEVVPTGHVIFQPSEGPQHSAAIGSDGVYQAELPAGTHKVGVFAPRESDKTGMEAFDEMPKPPYVPTWFNEPTSSGITTTIQENDENTFDITLEKNRRRRR